jgi:predicted permease
MAWSRFLRRARWDRERAAEIESYVTIETDENIASGMPPEEARAAACRKFGNTTLIREEIYHMNTMAFLDTLVRDLRYALRALRQNPTFTAVALLTLAIGIGANTAVFSVVNSVLLKPLAYPNAEELVEVRHMAPGAAGLSAVGGELGLSAPMYFTYAEQNRAFQALGVWSAGTASVTDLAGPEQVSTVSISDGVLEALSVPPMLGRWLGRVDQTPGAAETVLLSYGYWQRRFGGDRSVIGRRITIDSHPRDIVGVMPKRFRIVDRDPDVIVPFAFDRNRIRLPGYPFPAIGRLKPGVTIAQADADIASMVPIWIHSWPAPPGANPEVWETSWRIAPALRPLKQEVIGNVGNVLWILMGTIGIVMLIACANVTNLLLVRAEVRQPEIALRAALGAGAARIVGAMLVESVLLGLMGGMFGIAVAYGGLRLLAAIGPANLPRLEEISIDGRALLFALAISILSGAVLGLIPALKYAGPRIALALRGAGRGISLSRERHRVRNALVIAQVAMALVLLVSSGLMIRTFQALRTVQPGFTDARHLQIIQISIPPSLVPEAQRVMRMQNDIADKLAAIPGVTSVGMGEMPLEGLPVDASVIYAEDQAYDPNGILPIRLFKFVSPGFFRTAGTRLIAGRDLTWTEVYGFRPVGIISENLAREFWGNAAAAIGKRVREFPGWAWREVIGVVEDVHENGLQEKPPAIVYWPMMMRVRDDVPPNAVRTATFAMRTSRAGTQGFLEQVRQAVWSVNASLPVASVRTMQEIYERSLARTSFTLVMLAIAGAMALLLGLIGIYGVIAYAVSQRRREIGIRVALGAQQSELRRMFVSHALTLTAIGVAIGLTASAGLMRLMKSLLFGITPLDPLTYASVPAVLLAAALVASYLPARRAAAVDPVETLRAE